MTLIDWLARWATEKSDAKAFVFAPDRAKHIHLTFAELLRRSRALALRLTQHTEPGDRAVFLFPAGLDFIVAYLGCLAAGVIAVPLMVPRRTEARDSSAAVIADSAPRLAMTSTELLEARPDIADRFHDASFEWMTVNAMAEADEEPGELPSLGGDDLALLQYTSGSTSTPKGVMVTHDNLLANMEMIRQRMGNTALSTSVGWVPLYHDMGLMMELMQPLYLGATSVLMAPAAFMQRPLNWLRLIDRYRAEVTSAPNFAYDLCVSRFREDQMAGIDLSCWKVAMNAAEPVHGETIERFAATFAPYGFAAGAMYPAYGLAEATLLVSGGERGVVPRTRSVSAAALQRLEIAPAAEGDTQVLVSCGAIMPGQHVAIVDPDMRCRSATGRIGEIWVSGANVARGYWRNPAATADAFQAQIASEPGEHWLRTGDLGLLDEQGELFVTGRIKDLIIIRGVNHYPQDIERTVQESHPALRRDGGAAFAVSDEDGNERLAVVQEVERTHRNSVDEAEVTRCIREALARQHEIAVHVIALIPPATLPKTTSGKVQRSMARRLLLEGTLPALN
ncbi:MAG TPA: fatty acyl-AMP ligase [Acetobacteraceae bacterium]|nr:fatty acyl-AMP ligase [Acetobacteraceae bacterium]